MKSYEPVYNISFTDQCIKDSPIQNPAIKKIFKPVIKDVISRKLNQTKNSLVKIKKTNTKVEKVYSTKSGINRISKELKPIFDIFLTGFKEKSPQSCWLWTRGKNEKGRGVFTIKGVKYAANRISYYYFTGIKPKGWVLHTCKNLHCVNPRHLSN